MASAGPFIAVAPHQPQSALDHKNEGNAHFGKRRFAAASACYTHGLGVVNGDDALRAILLSNRSGCYYEIGNYVKASDDAKACITIIDASVDPPIPLLCKNLWRLARALHYSNADSTGEIHSTLRRLKALAEKSFSPKASKMLDQLTYYDKLCSGGESITYFEQMPLRASFQNPYHEYFNWGHDPSESLLCHKEIESHCIHLKDLNDDELSSLTFLFGGVGDGRHVMATLLDAHHQYLSLPSSKREKLQLRFTLNDISAQLLAKDALVLAMTIEMGRLARCFELAQTQREPFLLGTVIMYVTMGCAMPPFVHKQLMIYIELWFTRSSREDFLKTFPCLHMSAQTWDSIVAIMSAWVDADRSYSPKLPSVRETLHNYNPCNYNPFHDFSEGSVMFLSTMNKLFMEIAHVLYPPTGPVQELKEELAPLLSKHISNEDEAVAAIKQYLPTIHKTWVVNPIYTDPSYNTFLNGKFASDFMNPVKEFSNLFLNESVQSYMIEPPLTTANIKDTKKVRHSNTLTNGVILFYWNVGKALLDLSGKVFLEIALGSIIAPETSSKDRERIGLPTKYHRISLSNIPDYTGMLSVFCTISPLLASKSESITPSLRSNCLMNAGLWKTYDDYIFSTVSLSFKEAETVFRLKVTGDTPSAWGPFKTWERANSNVDFSAWTHDRLQTWLHRLYLSIILPPDRDPNTAVREERASTVDLFLMTISICIRDLGFPAHNMASILDGLLEATSLETRATLSNDSPASISSRNNSVKKKFDLSAFQAELANKTAIFMRKNLLGVRILSTKSLPVANASFYTLELRGISSKIAEDWNVCYGSVSSSASMGFMLQKERSSKYDIASGASDGDVDPMSILMSMMPGGREIPGKQKKKSELRKALLDSGDAIGHVFSCMRWNLETQTVSFWMCDDLFERFKSYAFALIRTDGWFQIPHNDVLLGDAKRIPST